MSNLTQSEEAALIKAARPELSGQEFRNVIYQGAEFEEYKIAKDGLLMSYKFAHLEKYKEGRPLEWGAVGGKGVKYPSVNLMLPADMLSYVDKNNKQYSPSTSTVRRSIKIHILVADAWLGIDECPTELKPYWPSMPVELKIILRKYFQVDHIDDNKHNPHVSNLRFVPPRDNQMYVKASQLGENPKQKLDMQNKINKLIEIQRNGKNSTNRI